MALASVETAQQRPFDPTLHLRSHSEPTQRLHFYLHKIESVVTDNRTLESFLMVVDNGSIAEAARRLNITAAGLAQRIRALETDIGARLIMRSGRRVSP